MAWSNEATEVVMGILAETPGLFLALIGWAASAKVICDTALHNVWQRGALLIFTWMLWMVPAFDIVVYHGIMPAHIAVTYCAAMTGALGLVISFTLFSNNKRSKQ
jgi:hypothetical protein